MRLTAKDLTLDEKIKLLNGKDAFNLHDLDGKLPLVRTSDGPNGLRPACFRNFSMTGTKGDKFGTTAMVNASSLANTWNRELCYLAGSTIADDCIDNNIDVLLAPGINIKRTPLCGRNFEYFSEDPYLAGALSKEYIEGVQSKGISATLKHFCLNNSETDRCNESSEIDERTMREIYLTPFEMALKAKPWAVMSSYNPVNGVYTCENKYLLKDVLRDEFGFDGLVMSDWWSVKLSWRSIQATLDLEMPLKYATKDQIEYGLENGYITEEDIDERVNKVLNFIYKTQNSLKKAEFTMAQRHENVVKIARESMVLLKNDGVLPITKGKIAVGGHNALSGGGSAENYTDYEETPLHELITKNLNGNGEVKISMLSMKVDHPAETDHSKTFYELAYDSDYAVIVVSTGPIIEREGRNRETIKLDSTQIGVIKNTKKYCKNVIVVLNTGSAVDVSDFIDDASAILQGGFAGEGFNEAVADILTGKANPSGKLAETYPINIENVPFNRGNGMVNRYSEGVFVGYRYYDSYNIPVQFPFGHGLSYSKFEYKDLIIDKLSETDYKVKFKIKNVSNAGGSEVCQLYVKDVLSAVSRPEKELKGFDKIHLEPGEEKQVEITLDSRSFAFYSPIYKKWHIENGWFEILIGSSSKDIRLTDKIKISLPEDTQYSFVFGR